MRKIMTVLVAIIATVSLLTSCDPDPIVDPVDPILGDIHITSDIIVNTTWTANNVYYVDNSIDVTDDAILTIEPGTTIKFAQDVAIDVSYYSSSNGNIVAIGTAALPITFTSQALVPAKGDWGDISFFEGATSSVLEYCIFEYGAGSSSDNGVVMLRSSGKNLSVDHCTFRHNADYGVYVYDCPLAFNYFTNNTFTDNTTNDIYVAAYNVSSIGDGNVFEKSIRVRGSGDIETPGTVLWKNHNADYIIDGAMDIGSTTGTILEIEKGCVLKFTSTGGIDVGYYSSASGALVAVGTATEPIIFTSANTSPFVGDWNDIHFYDNCANGCILDHCEISYAGSGGGNYANIVVGGSQGAKITIQNCHISDSEGYGITYYSSLLSYPTTSNNTFSNNNSGDELFQ